MRDASTYRGARRNACFNERQVWSSAHYYTGHNRKRPARVIESKKNVVMRGSVEAAKSAVSTGLKAVPAIGRLMLRRAARGQ